MINHLAFLCHSKQLTLNYFTQSQSDNVGNSIRLDPHFPKISLFHFYIKKNIINKEIIYNKIYNKMNAIEQSVMLKMIRWNYRLYMKSKHVNH